MKEVGCERLDGLLNVHPASETCEVCAPASVEGEVPKVEKVSKHKHFFAPGYETCQCGAQRCNHRDGMTGTMKLRCKGVAGESGLCRKHNRIAEAEQESKRGFWSAARIAEILEKSDQTTTLESGKVVKNSLIIYRFLQRMFERQTQDEQANFSTSHDNGVGFAGGDARLLSDMATGSKKFNDDYKAKYDRVNADGLTVRQARYVASRLKKYVKTQLVEIANEATSAPMPEAVTQQTIQAALHRPESQQLELHNVGERVADMQRSDPTKYYDPFGEGERLTEEAAREFWTKRFGSM